MTIVYQSHTISGSDGAAASAASMASLIQHARSGYFYAQFFDQHRQPARKRVALRTKKRRTAERALSRLEDAFALGTFDPWTAAEVEPAHTLAPERPNLSQLGDAAQAFLNAKAHLRPRTIRTYRQIVEAFAAFMGEDYMVARITPKDVLRWLASTKARDVTRKKYNHHLGYLWRFLMREGWMMTDISKAVPLRRVPEQAPKALTQAEVNQLLRTIVAWRGKRGATCRLAPDRAWLYTAVVLGVYAGLRRGELVHLRWTHVDFDRSMLRVANTDAFTTKSGRERAIPLCDEAIEALRLHRARNPTATHVLEVNGHQVAPGTISYRLKVFVRRAGLPEHYHLHALRHTFGTWLSDRGVPLHALMRLMGHGSLGVTQRYLSGRDEVLSAWVRQAFATSAESIAKSG